MLMMVTIFPILVRLGVSPVGAAAAVATGHLLDIGPASATTLLVSKTVNMPVHEYFVDYQLKVYIICGLMAAIAHFVWQKYLDKSLAMFLRNMWRLINLMTSKLVHYRIYSYHCCH